MHVFVTDPSLVKYTQTSNKCIWILIILTSIKTYVLSISLLLLIIRKTELPYFSSYKMGVSKILILLAFQNKVALLKWGLFLKEQEYRMRVPTLGCSCIQKILSRKRGITLSKKNCMITSPTGMGSPFDSEQLL